MQDDLHRYKQRRPSCATAFAPAQNSTALIASTHLHVCKAGWRARRIARVEMMCRKKGGGLRVDARPFIAQADAVFDSSLVYELSVIKVFAERYLLEVPQEHPAFVTAYRLRQLIDKFVTIYPDHVPPTSILREFIGESGFEY